MTERYVQSLAILLAGLFSAERLRSDASRAGLFVDGGQEPTKDPEVSVKAREH
ncbi:MAG TPA: hypothetical protein VER04_21820 [Polyangiaceae bacterium]|nr:hypothetical protein [Polyangiaceae bacterium]